MNAFAQHFAFEFRTGLRSKDLMLLNYLFPLFFYVMMGVLMGGINPAFIETMIPAMAIFAVLSGTILGLPNPLVEQREAGIFRSFRVNGVPAASILLIPALTTGFHAIIAGIIMTVTAPFLFNAPQPVDYVSFGLIIVLTAFSCAGLGALIGVISSNSRVTILWSQLIFLPSMMLSGMMVPLSMLPGGLARLAAVLPPTHAMQAMIGLAYQQATPWNPSASVLVLAAGTILSFVMAIYLFNWDSQNISRRRHPALALIALAPYLVSVFLLG
jgi:ABC-2 type transport system permease protein